MSKYCREFFVKGLRMNAIFSLVHHSVGSPYKIDPTEFRCPKMQDVSIKRVCSVINHLFNDGWYYSIA